MSDEVEDFLAHYGVKGMKWGKRNARPEGVSRSIDRKASKDAAESARAKMFYGEGAGNRRKLIKAQVDARSKDPAYKKAFEQRLSEQDLGKHASKAKSERRRKDVTGKTAKTARGVHRQLTGGFGSVSLASAAIAGAYVAARQTGADKIVINAAKQSFSNARSQNRNKGPEDWLKKNGFL